MSCWSAKVQGKAGVSHTACNDEQNPEATVRGIKRLLSSVVEEGDAEKALANEHAPKQERLANRDCLLKLGHQLVQNNGWGLAAFSPQQHVGALPPGGRRYLAPQTCPITGERRMRACVEAENGCCRFEVPRKMVDGVHDRPTAHLSQDMCSASCQCGSFLMHGTGIRGTQSSDRFHRHGRDLEDATADAGLRVIKTEYKIVLKLRKGPFNQNGNHHVLVAAAREMFTVYPNGNNALLDIFYDDFCSELSDFSPNRGTPEHYDGIWLMCKTVLVDQSVGDTMKSFRFWATETKAKQFRPHRSMNQMLLIFVGFRRQWWVSFNQTPLCSQMAEPLAEQAEPAAAGLEALEAEGAAEEAAPVTDALDEPSSARISDETARREIQKRN